MASGWDFVAEITHSSDCESVATHSAPTSPTCYHRNTVHFGCRSTRSQTCTCTYRIIFLMLTKASLHYGVHATWSYRCRSLRYWHCSFHLMSSLLSILAFEWVSVFVAAAVLSGMYWGCLFILASTHRLPWCVSTSNSPTTFPAGLKPDTAACGLVVNN